MSNPTLDKILARTMVTDACWLWLGPRNTKGYGHLTHEGRTQMTHRLAYQSAKGAIPEGGVVDHVCHDPAMCASGIGCIHRLCVNPDHLVAVSASENTARQTPAAATHCIHGHRYTADTTGRTPSGQRYCKACRSERAAEAARRRPAAHARSSAIRTWAKSQGIPVSTRGRVSEAVIAAWEGAGSPGWATQPEAAATPVPQVA